MAVSKGADKMLHDEFMFASDELIAEATAKLSAEKDKNLAEKMILNDEPLEKIEQYTGMNVAALKPIAQMLGKKLVV